MHGGIVGEQDLVLLQCGIGDGDCRDQAAGVGMHGEVKQLLSLGDLNDVTLVDNADAVGNETDDGQVVGDEQVGDIALLLELLQQVQDLCTNGNVQCGDGLVGNDQLGLHDHGTGQADSLTLTAGELVGVTGQMLGQQTDFLDHALDLLDAVLLILEELEVVQALGDDVVDGSTLVQGSGGILEDHLDVTDDLAVQAAGGLAGDANALVLDLTSSQGVDADNGTADGGLAGAGLTNQGESLTLVNIERGVLNGLDRIVALAEGDVHILEAQQNFSAVLIDGAMLRQMSSTINFFAHSRILLKC